MTVAAKIKELLEKEKVNYQVLEHDLAFTALEVAQAQHLPGHQVVKSIIVGADGKWAMCVLPATHRIDFSKLQRVLKAKDIKLASEEQAASFFPNYEVGAMPPFGHVVGMTVYVDKSLEENEAIAFNAGTHTDVLKIRFKDYVRIAKPIIEEFSIHI